MRFIDVIIAYPYKLWDWIELSSSAAITLRDIEDHIEYPWNKTALCDNPNMRLSFVIRHMRTRWVQHLWSWDHLMKNPGLYNISLNNSQITIDWFHFALNPCLTEADILAYPQLQINFQGLCASMNIRLQFIKDHPEIPWDFTKLSRNRHITIQYMHAFPNEEWDWCALTHRIETADILANPDFPWLFHPHVDEYGVLGCSNPRSPWFVIYDYIKNPSISDQSKIDVYMSRLSSDTHRTVMSELSGYITSLETVLEYKGLNWDWNMLSCNPNITLADIQANPELPWNFGYMSGNPNITMEFIVANNEASWNYTVLSRNKFKIEKHIISNADAKERMSLVKEELIAAAWHPRRAYDWCFDFEQKMDDMMV